MDGWMDGWMDGKKLQGKNIMAPLLHRAVHNYTYILFQVSQLKTGIQGAINVRDANCF